MLFLSAHLKPLLYARRFRLYSRLFYPERNSTTEMSNNLASIPKLVTGEVVQILTAVNFPRYYFLFCGTISHLAILCFVSGFVFVLFLILRIIYPAIIEYFSVCFSPRKGGIFLYSRGKMKEVKLKDKNILGISQKFMISGGFFFFK